MTIFCNIQYKSNDSKILRAWIWRAVSLCSGSSVEPNWLAAHIKEADVSPRRRLVSSCIVAKGGASLPLTCPMSSCKNSPHFNLKNNISFIIKLSQDSWENCKHRENERYGRNQESQIKTLSRVIDPKSEVYLFYLFSCLVYKRNFSEQKCIDK